MLVKFDQLDDFNSVVGSPFLTPLSLGSGILFLQPNNGMGFFGFVN